VFLRGAPRTSAYVRSAAGEAAAWGPIEHLLAMVVDALRLANWQRGGDKFAPRPDPVPRPGVSDGGQRLGSDPIPASQFDDWWASN